MKTRQAGSMRFEDTLQLVIEPAARHHKAFVEGRDRQPTLMPFATAVDAVSFASDGSKSEAERSRVVDAFVAEHRRGISPLWQLLLVRTFEDRLVDRREGMGPRDNEDLDQRLYVAFIEALGLYDFSTGTPFPAIDEMTRIALGVLRRAERAVGKLTGDGELPEIEAYEATRDMDVHEVLTILPTIAGPEDEEIVDLFVATLLNGESLGEFVEREYPGLDSEEYDATCARLRRDRAEMVMVLNAHLTRGRFVPVSTTPLTMLH